MRKVSLLLFVTLSSFIANAQFAGNALQFDGSNDYVTSAIPAALSGASTNDFTIEAWVYPQAVGFTRIVYSQNTTSNVVSLATGPSNSISLYVVVGNTQYGNSTVTTLPTNQWTHVAARWTASTHVMRIFFNGVQQGTASTGSTTLGTSNGMVIGSKTGGTQYFSGVLDELRIWNYGRSQCEIVAAMKSSLLGSETGLSAYYKFNQGIASGNNATETSLLDSGPNAIVGTLNNFALNGATSNWITSTADVTLNGTTSNITNQTVDVCSGSNYTFPDGFTQTNITAQAVHTSNFTSVNLCDSSIKTTVNVVSLYQNSQTVSVCSGSAYIFPDGFTQQNITSQVMHTSHLTSLHSCDSIINTTVNVLPSFGSTQTVQICSGDNYTFLDGTTQANIVTSFTHQNVLQSVSSCDSIVNTSIQLITVDATIAQSGNILTAATVGASYQWINCATNQPVGVTTQIFTASANGNYAVVVTQNGCSDTSACAEVTALGINKNSLDMVQLFPNPTNGNIAITLGQNFSDVQVKMTDITGKKMYSAFYQNTDVIYTNLEVPVGIYMVSITTSNGDGKTFKLIKN